MHATLSARRSYFVVFVPQPVLQHQATDLQQIRIVRAVTVVQQ